MVIAYFEELIVFPKFSDVCWTIAIAAVASFFVLEWLTNLLLLHHHRHRPHPHLKKLSFELVLF